MGSRPLLHRPPLSRTSPLLLLRPHQCSCSLGSFLRRLTVRRTSVCTARLGVQPPRRVEHATDNPGPHSLCRARLRKAPTTLLVLPSSFARSASWAFWSACAPPRLSSQLVRFTSFSMVGINLMWALVHQFELASWPALCGSRACQGDSRVHLRHLCRGDG